MTGTCASPRAAAPTHPNLGRTYFNQRALVGRTNSPAPSNKTCRPFIHRVAHRTVLAMWKRLASHRGPGLFFTADASTGRRELGLTLTRGANDSGKSDKLGSHVLLFTGLISWVCQGQRGTAADINSPALQTLLNGGSCARGSKFLQKQVAASAPDLARIGIKSVEARPGPRFHTPMTIPALIFR